MGAVKINYFILGGAVGPSARYRLGPSCYLLVVTILGRTWRFLVDCGLEPSQIGGWKAVNLEVLERILGGEKIDAVLITHAHLDHCGYAPALMKYMAPDAKVISTTTTAALLSHHVLADIFQQAYNRDRMGPLAYFPFDLVPSMEFCELAEKYAVPFPQVIVLGPGVEVLVWPAGHIHGACSFIFRFTEHGVVRKMAFLGDYSLHRQLIIPPAPLLPPDWLLTGRGDAILSVDCTNGAGELPDWDRELDRMADDSTRVVERGGKWIATTFSIVRWQILIHELLRRTERAGTEGIVYGDGPSAYRIGNILKKYPWGDVGEFDLSGAVMVGSWFEGEEVTRKSVIESARGARIFTPSGMGHGPATDYLVSCLEDERSAVVSTGFAALGTNIRRVLDASPGEEVLIEGAPNESGETFQRIRVRAEHDQYRLTGHQHRVPAVGRALELFGVGRTAIEEWERRGREGNLREYLSGSDLARLQTKRLFLTHATSDAFDWFETYFAGVIKTSRADREEDRAIEL